MVQGSRNGIVNRVGSRGWEWEVRIVAVRTSHCAPVAIGANLNYLLVPKFPEVSVIDLPSRTAYSNRRAKYETVHIPTPTREQYGT